MHEEYLKHSAPSSVHEKTGAEFAGCHEADDTFAIIVRGASDKAVVVGSGPNGLAAAVTLQRAGVQVLLIEREQTVGGGMRTKELTLPGFRHDVCSAIHPMALLSPFF